jgi:hypothetical protein
VLLIPRARYSFHTSNNSKELLLHGPTLLPFYHPRYTTEWLALKPYAEAAKRSSRCVWRWQGEHVAVPSATDQGGHLYFDLEPLPAHFSDPGDINAIEGMMEDSRCRHAIGIEP